MCARGWLLLMTLAWSLRSTGCSGSRCRACDPCPPRPPATIIVSPEPTPCRLPELPQPTSLGEVVAADGTATIPRAGMVALATYLLGVREWVAAAQACLEVSAARAARPAAPPAGP